MIDKSREMLGSVKVREKNSENVWWNDMLKVAIERKEVLEARDEVAKERYMEDYKEEKRKVKSCIYHIKMEVNEHFRKKINEDEDGNKLFWKEASTVNVEKLESCSRIKDGNGRQELGEDGVQRTWEDYFENLYNTNTKEQVIVHMYDFSGIQRGNYFKGGPIRTEVKVTMEKNRRKNDGDI